MEMIREIRQYMEYELFCAVLLSYMVFHLSQYNIRAKLTCLKHFIILNTYQEHGLKYERAVKPSAPNIRKLRMYL